MILFDFLSSTPTVAFFKTSKYPPGLDNAANCSGSPIAFITKGAPTFSPLISIIFPPQDMLLVGTNL